MVLAAEAGGSGMTPIWLTLLAGSARRLGALSYDDDGYKHSGEAKEVRRKCVVGERPPVEHKQGDAGVHHGPNEQSR